MIPITNFFNLHCLKIFFLLPEIGVNHDAMSTDFLPWSEKFKVNRGRFFKYFSYSTLLAILKRQFGFKFDESPFLANDKVFLYIVAVYDKEHSDHKDVLSN